MTSPLPQWRDRPREVANLYNPAFTSLLLGRCVSNYETVREAQGLPLALAFLVLPIVLHPRFRSHLPRAADTDMFAWIANHPDLRALLPSHAEAMKPVTQEALRFALIYGALVIQGADLISGTKRFAKTTMPPSLTDDVSTCMQKAAFIGRWFAQSTTPVTILATWGVRP